MTTQGELKYGHEIGNTKYPSYLFYWRVCPGCHKAEWVFAYPKTGKPRSLRCRVCAGHARKVPTKVYKSAPVEGEIRRGDAIGKHSELLYVWSLCRSCGKGRWLGRSVMEKYPRCRNCCHAHSFQQRLGTISKPVIGDVRLRSELGFKTSLTQPMIYAVCLNCGKNRWVWYKPDDKSPSRVCPRCYTAARTGDKNPAWKGGRRHSTEGYIRVLLRPEDPYYKMADARGTVLEHRLAMARHEGRLLESSEEVHHKNLDRTDNRIENLELRTRYHGSGTADKQNIVTERAELKAENEALRDKIKTLEKRAPDDGGKVTAIS